MVRGAGSTNMEDLRHRKLQAKRITKELRAHVEELQDKSDVMQNPRDEALVKEFKRSEENAQKATNVDQKLLDAQIFNRLGDFAKRQAAQMQTGLKDYDVTSFVDKLAQLMNSSEEGEAECMESKELNLFDLGGDMGRLFATAPTFYMLYGNSDVKPKQREVKAKAKRAKKGTAAVKPAELEKEDIVETETDKQVAKMFRELRRLGSVNYWEFVIDPKCFMRSIENTFHSSFLVKDGKAKLDLESDPPVISYLDLVRAAENGDDALAVEKERNAVNSQYILRFDYRLWQEVVEKYSISECLLPSDAPNVAADGRDGDDDDDVVMV